jgi:transposase
MAGELVVMSTREIDRMRVVQNVLEGRLTLVKAGALLDLGARQVARLCSAYEREGAAGLVSRKRGRVSNRRIEQQTEDQIALLVRTRYEDFGPTLVREKLREPHGINVGKETVRRVLIRAGIWRDAD